MNSSDSRATGENGEGHRRLWHSFGEVLALIAPTSVLTGVLYYFGFVSAKAYYAYFGVSLSALDFSTTSYLLRSADTFFKPVATLLLVLSVAFGVHHLLGQVLGRAGPTWAGGVALGLCGISAIAAGVGLLGLYGEARGLWSPLALAASGLLLEYGIWTMSRYADPPASVLALIQAGIGVRRGLIATLVCTAVFWAVTVLAQERGTTNARLFEESLPLKPQAVVYSQKDLKLPGVRVRVLEGKDSAYRFLYNGLRPLLYANNRWFLLPVGWTRDNGATVIVLQDDPGQIRVDLAPGLLR
jgi:hypothetical protein